MHASTRPLTFSTANPHALAIILEAAETRRIIASRDIFDLSGIKLWARDQPVSAALQRKLLDRQLRNPLESCLMAADGVTPQTLVQSMQQQLERRTPLTALLLAHRERLVHEVARLPLHPVAQLLLTATQVSRAERFEHALQAMALAGALMIDKGVTNIELRIAMLGGLLHDLGEMYIDPRAGEFDAERRLDFISYQQLVVHPHVGQLIVAQLTDYPGSLARAIGEHHERLDGSGYPHGLLRQAISPLGRLLAVTEATLAALRDGRNGLARASVALRVVPDEFDLDWVGRISAGARAEPACEASLNLDKISQRLNRLDTALLAAEATTAELVAQASGPALSAALALAGFLLARLRKGWITSGLWSPQAMAEQDGAEVEAIEEELFHRLRSIERATRLRAGELDAPESAQLERLCEVLSGAAS